MPWSRDPSAALQWGADVVVFAAIESDLLARVVAIELALVIIGLVGFFGHAAWTKVTGPRTARRIELGSRALNAVLEKEDLEARDLAPLAALPRKAQIAALAGVATSLAGEQRRSLTAIAGHLGLLAHAATRCRSRFWWRRLQGARLFTLLGSGEKSVPPLFGDRRSEVRAQAARWAIENHNDEVIERLLQMLDRDDPTTRFAVTDAVIRIGREVTDRLVVHLNDPTSPTKIAALKVAVALAEPALLPAGLRLCEADDPEVRALAARLVGALGGDPAINMLMRLLRDDAAEVRAAAARALGKAGHWPAAEALAELLGDSSWDVRRNAGIALRALGSPGRLFLRRALSADDPFAADAARQMLDLPESSTRALQR